MGRRLDLKAASSRAAASIPAIIQIVIGAIASYSIAHFALGHATPLLSITVVISTLGFSRDARPQRVLGNVVSILIGILLSELVLQLAGKGLWQIALVLTVTLLIARFALTSEAFAVAAGLQSMLVMIQPAPSGGPFVRVLDGVIAGVIALLMTALIPRDPRRIALRDARNLGSTLTEALTSMIEGARDSDEAAASLALERLRKTQGLIDNWSSSLDSAIAIARISPFLRRHLPALRRETAVLQGFDLAARHLRVIGRRVFFLVRDGSGRQLPELLGDIQRAIVLLGSGIVDSDNLAKAADLLSDLAPRLDPRTIMPGAPTSEGVIVLLARPLVIDLLVAAGSTADAARALLPLVE